MLHAEHQGRSYATEGACALRRLAFEEFDAHSVIATRQPENTASCRVAETLRMRREGPFHKCIASGDSGR